MKKIFTICAIVTMVLTMGGATFASYSFFDGFETAWAGSYADGWQNIDYRWGTASSSVMTQYSNVTTTNGHTITPMSGSYFMGVKVTAAGDPETSTNWWGGAVPMIQSAATSREYSPWVSVSFYDDGALLPVPQLSLVPDTGNPDDWTDIQYGIRWSQANHYWFGEAMNYPSIWVETSVDRTVGWHQLKLSQDIAGYITYSIDGTVLGTTTNAYLDLGGTWLQTQFSDGVFGESEVYFDNFEFGSSIPEPATIMMLGLGALSLIRIKRRGT